MRGIPLILLCALLAGCGSIVKDRSQVPLSPVGGFGMNMGTRDAPEPTAGRPGWRNADVVVLDLPVLISGYTEGAAGPSHTIEEALAKFDTGGDPADRATRRNAIVGAVLMASDKNCDVYLEYFHGNQIAIKSISSVSSTILSGAAAVTTPASSSRILAALGSAATGVGGNLNDAAFSSRAADVIVSGIRAERAGLRRELDERMRDTGYSAWPLSLALADALRYHGRCNAISGLSYLQGAAERGKTADEGTAPPAPPQNGQAQN